MRFILHLALHLAIRADTANPIATRRTVFKFHNALLTKSARASIDFVMRVRIRAAAHCRAVFSSTRQSPTGRSDEVFAIICKICCGAKFISDAYACHLR
ncbi:hypothetical protein [Pandoraea aquatica]|uniref:hypothetical protein n=1 Tax=Pandoraea aquatica TaxID=2508290 RepID=UPI001241ECED|nr:hypothetical protein [Pandoraea aquatica]